MGKNFSGSKTLSLNIDKWQYSILFVVACSIQTIMTIVFYACFFLKLSKHFPWRHSTDILKTFPTACSCSNICYAGFLKLFPVLMDKTLVNLHTSQMRLWFQNLKSHKKTKTKSLPLVCILQCLLHINAVQVLASKRWREETPPQGDFSVQRQGWKIPGWACGEQVCTLWYFFLSVLQHCWLGDMKHIRPVGSWALVCLWW